MEAFQASRPGSNPGGRTAFSFPAVANLKPRVRLDARVPAKKSAKKVAAKRPVSKKAPARRAASKKSAPKKAVPKRARANNSAPKRASDWRAAALARMRGLIREALPDVVEEVKWRKPSNPDGVPTWSHGGLICTGETYKDYVKLTFARGALLPDPARLFNAGFAGNTRRAIDIREDDAVDATAFKALVREAAALNASKR